MQPQDVIGISDDNRDIFVVVLSDELEIPFFLPSIKEAKRYSFLLSVAQSPVTAHSIYMEIFKKFCVDKTIFDMVLPAGTYESVAKLMMWLSGYGEEPLKYTEKLIDEQRAQIDLLLNTMRRTICSAFKSYKLEDIDKMDLHKVVELFVNAEKVLIEAGIISEKGFEIASGKEDKKVKVEDLIKQDRQDIKKLDGPPEMRKLQRGEAPPRLRRRK